MTANTHWTSKYVGMRVIPGVFDCATLAEQVQREVFNKVVNIPSEKPTDEAGVLAKFHARQEQIASTKDTLCERTNSPREGDAVLMQSRGYRQHIGTLVYLNNDVWVLHTDDRAKQVVLQRAREMPMRGLMIEGYYRWK